MMGYALIAGSDPADAATYSRIVREEGLEPVVARDGEEARALLLGRGAPDLLIAELSLPRADGFTLLGDLRRIATREETPAIVVSGVPDLRATALLLQDQLGVDDVVSPVSRPEDLRRAVRGALSRRPHEEGEGASARIPASPAEVLRGERSRLARIASMDLVDDRPPDEALQKLVEETALAFRVPIALVSLILEDRQWFKAYYGLEGSILEARDTPRDVSFCRHVVEGDGCRPLVVPDAATHPYFASNPLVKAGLVRSYAGAPLVTPDGHVLGTLCIIDSRPLNIGPDEIEALVALARRVAGELEARWAAVRAMRGGPDSAVLATMEAIGASVECGILVLDADRRVVLANRALGRMFGLPEGQIVSMSREEFVLRASATCEDPKLFLRTLRVFPEGPFCARARLEVGRPPRAVRWIAKPVHLPSGVGQLEIFDDLAIEAAPGDPPGATP